MVNYREMAGRIRYCEEYKHSSSHAELSNLLGDEDDPMYGGEYTIYSYNTVIAIVDVASRRVITFNEKKYSMTTSRLQNLIKRELDYTPTDAVVA